MRGSKHCGSKSCEVLNTEFGSQTVDGGSAFDRASWSSFSALFAEKLFGVCGAIVGRVGLGLGEEVGAEQTAKVDKDHQVHEHHGAEEIAGVVQTGVVPHNVRGEEGLGAQAEEDVGGKVEQPVEAIQPGSLSSRQLQHQPHVQEDAVNLHEESHHCTCHVASCHQGIQEGPDHLRRLGEGKTPRGYFYWGKKYQLDDVLAYYSFVWPFCPGA